MKRILVLLLTVALMLFSVAACVQPGSDSDGDGVDSDGGEAAVAGGRVVYLINGALGDNAFYDSGQLGIEQLAEEYGLETRTIETNFDAGQYEPALEAAVAYADVIFVISYGFEDQLKEIADQNPDKVFVNIDTVVQNDNGTITSVDFIEEESAYLTGVVAAMTTLDTSLSGINEEKIIGAVGGDVDPVINAFIFAYTNGAHSVDPEIQVESTFLGSWDDTAKGKQAALQLYDQGSDINFQIAAAAGLGVLQAAAERDLYAIGVDTNQNDLEPGHVVASDLKDVGRAITEVYATIADGSYEAGQVLEYGLASGAVDVTFEAEQQVLPQSIIDHVDEVREQIVNGELTIERYTGE